MSIAVTNTPRAGESAEQKAVRADRGPVRRGRLAIMDAGHALQLPTNGLAGAKLNEDGDGI